MTPLPFGWWNKILHHYQQQQPPSKCIIPVYGIIHTTSFTHAPPMAGLNHLIVPPSLSKVTEVLGYSRSDSIQTLSTLPPQFPPPPYYHKQKNLTLRSLIRVIITMHTRHLLTPHPATTQLKPLTRKWGCLIYTQRPSIKGRSPPENDAN